MNKIICDICGTAYPETADKCPICGNAKQVEGSAVQEPVSENGEQPVKAVTKGGHFSNANVRKRNKGKKVVKTQKKVAKPAEPAEEQSEEPKGGLVAAVWVLLIAVIMVLAYIVIQFVLPMYGITLPDLLSKPAESTTASTEASTTATTLADETTVDTGVACTGLTVAGGDIVLDAVGREWLLEVTVEPGDTTDVVTYVSENEAVATVSEQGRVTAVGPGKTVITVTCGNMVQQVNVDCAFGEETTVPEETTAATEEPTTEEPEPSTEATEPPVDFGLMEQDDVTLFKVGETFEFETGSIYLSEIVWTSDDPSVATVERGEVTAVGSGMTVIRAEYNGQTDSCIIRCEFEDGATEPEEDEDDDSEYPRLWPAADVSIRLGESFELDYVNAEGEWTDIYWSSDDESVAVVDGNVVTGVGYGVAIVSGTYDGEEITCTVRVRDDMAE